MHGVALVLSIFLVGSSGSSNTVTAEATTRRLDARRAIHNGYQGRPRLSTLRKPQLRTQTVRARSELPSSSESGAASARAHAEYLPLLPEMIRRVEDLQATTKTTHPVFPLDDGTLLRFLRHGRGNIDKAEKAFRKMDDWRKNTLLADAFDFPEDKLVRRAYKKGYFNTDREGRPLYIEMIGNVDIDALEEATTLPRLIHAHAHDTDHLASVIIPWCQRNLNASITGITAVMDLRGISWKQFTHPFIQGYIKNSISIDYNYYPSTLARMFILIPSGVPETVWKLAQPWIPKTVKAKIQVLSVDEFQAKLREEIPPENLPRSLGGTSPLSDDDFFLTERGGWIVEHQEQIHDASSHQSASQGGAATTLETVAIEQITTVGEELSSPSAAAAAAVEAEALDSNRDAAASEMVIHRDCMNAEVGGGGRRR